MKLDRCSALITGASAGIGREFARQLAGRAHTLVLVARRAERLNQLRNELLRPTEARVANAGSEADGRLRSPSAATAIHTRAIDLANKSQIDELVRWLGDNNIEIDFLINNAGLGDAGPFATSDQRRNDEMILVNVLALTSLSRVLLPQMISRKHGAILNVSSSAGFLPIPEFNVYAATKAYVTSFSESLRTELLGTGVTVTVLCPGPVHTEFGDVATRPASQPVTGPQFVYVGVDEVVRSTLAAVEANKPLVIPGLLMKLGMFFVRITPMAILRLAWRLGVKRR
jgi:hypothetical protein